QRVICAARAPRGQYDFVDTVEAGQGLIRSPGHDAQTIARAAGRAEDVGYVSQRRRVRILTHSPLDARGTDRRDIRLEMAYWQRTRQLKTPHDRMEWQQNRGAEDGRQSDRSCRTQVLRGGLELGIDMMEDAAMIDRAIQRNSTQDDGSQSSGGGIRRPVDC
ncbi:hypothetical protein Tco_1086845, partial [Tanacetum coccineum]